MNEKEKIVNQHSFNKARRLSQVFSFALAVVMSSQSLGAQLEEIVVTAQKRDQSIQDIGFSVSAIDSEDAARYSADPGSLAGLSPGVEAYGTGAYVQSFFIRGVGLNEFAGNFNAPVAIHNDEAYVAKNWMAGRPTFDIERIEILKGPQGTLFGRNTTGGAVNYYRAAPTQETEGYFRLTADEYSRASAEGAVSGALGDNLSGRLSIYRGFGSGGPQDNLFTGDEHGSPDVTELRGQLQWDLEATTVRLLAYGGTDQSETVAYKSPGIYASGGTPGFCPQVLAGDASFNPGSCPKFAEITTLFDTYTEAEYEPNGIHTINQNHAPVRDDSFSGAYMRVNHEFGNTTFTSITSVDAYERRQREDSDGTPIASNDLDIYGDIDVFAQEFRLSGTAADERMNYVVGLFYQTEELRQADSLELTENPFNLVGAGLPPRLTGVLEQEVESVAFYFNADYSLSDNLVLTFGGRYTEDETDAVWETTAGLNDVVGKENLPVTTLAVIDSGTDTLKDDNFSWRLGLSYNIDEDTLLYTNLATGYRSGGFSVPFGGIAVEFKKEELSSIEFGYKSDLSESVRLNTAVFFFRYEDLQVNVDDPISPIAPITRNVDESETFGFEADLTWLPTDNLELSLGYAYLDAEFTETDRVMTTISTAGPISLQGNTPVNSPENQFNLSLEYVDQLVEGWNWSAYADLRWVDERYLEVTNQPADLGEAYTVLNGGIGFQSEDNTWSLTIWGRNLTDETYITYMNNLPGPGFKLDIFGEQRSIGATVDYNF